MTDDLVGRLRKGRLIRESELVKVEGVGIVGWTGEIRELPHPDALKAAARIEALEGENRRLREALTFIRNTPNVAYRLTAKEALGETLSWEEENGWDERG